MGKIKLAHMIKKFIILLLGILIGMIFSFFIYPKLKMKNGIDPESLFGKPLVEVDGKVWTSTSLPKDSAFEFYNLENNIFNAEKYFVSQVALRIALAKDLGLGNELDHFPNLKELLKINSIEDHEVRKYYDDLVRKDGIAVFAGQSYEKIKPQLKLQLTNQKITELASIKLREMIRSKRINLLLPPVLGSPTNLDISLFPFRGNPNSEITFVNIYDYADLNSREIESDLKKIVKNYSTKIKFVSIDYPQNPNGMSGALARGAFCAREQGEQQFWNFHNEIFHSPIPKFEPSMNTILTKKMDNEVIGIAKEVNLDIKSFSSCLNSNKAYIYIQNVRSQLNSTIGYQGIPSYYLNRRPISYSLNEIEKTFQENLK